jgi:hypothetical protein
MQLEQIAYEQWILHIMAGAKMSKMSSWEVLDMKKDAWKKFQALKRIYMCSLGAFVFLGLGLMYNPSSFFS